MQMYLTDPQVAQLTHAHPRAAKNLNHHTPTAIATTDTDAETAHMKAHRPRRHTKALGNLQRTIALTQQTRDLPRSWAKRLLGRAVLSR
jgi:hypothetical protein